MADERSASMLELKTVDAISLHPERWEQDGLYAEEGISLARARALLPGIEEMDLEAYSAVTAA